jgi:hypothetical protein
MNEARSHAHHIYRQSKGRNGSAVSEREKERKEGILVLDEEESVKKQDTDSC